VMLGSRGLGKVGEWVGVALTMKALSSPFNQASRCRTVS
jgi:hypothetical protein